MTKLAKMWNNRNTQMLLVGMSKRYNCEEVKDAYNPHSSSPLLNKHSRADLSNWCARGG